MHKFLLSQPEFKGFAAKVPADRKFPESTLNLAKVFDLYCMHYIEKYNELIKKMIGCVVDDFGMIDEQRFLI